MNIRMWVYIATGVVGAVIGLAIGFVTYKVTRGTLDFVVWATDDYWGRPRDAMAWAIGGAIVGAGIAFIRRTNSN